MKKPDSNHDDFLLTINSCLNKTNLNEIRKDITHLKSKTLSKAVENNGQILINTGKDIIEYSQKLVEIELEQILNTQTIERTKYYIKRLIKSLSHKKMGKVNDLNLNRWKEYDDLITDSLWIFDKRDTSGAHKAGYWGNFIPQIPNQLLKRIHKKRRLGSRSFPR